MALMNLAFTVKEYRERLRGVQREMARRELDVLLCHIFPNINYLTGIETIGHYGYSRILLLVPLEGDPVLLGSSFEIENARISAWTQDRVPYEIGTPFLEALRRLLMERGWERKRLGIEENCYALTIADYRQLETLLPNARLCAATGTVESVRHVKSPAEVEYMRQAAKLSDAGLLAAIETAAEGKSDNDLAAAGYQTMIGGGSEYPALAPIVTVGERSSIPHSTFCRIPLRRGDSVLMEFSGCIRRYHAPVMRGVAIGCADDGLKRMADGCIASLNTTIEEMKPGAPAAQVAAKSLAALKGAVPNLDRLIWHGCYAYSTGIGFPSMWDEGGGLIMLESKDILRPGMVFHVSTSLREVGKYGTAFSETVAVTETGHEVLTHTPRRLVIK